MCLLNGVAPQPGTRQSRLPFGTLVERTEAAEITVAARLDQEDIELMTGNTDAGSGFIGRTQGMIGRAGQRPKTMQ